MGRDRGVSRARGRVATAGVSVAGPLVSVVIPVLHDAAALTVLLAQLPSRTACQIVVATGASDDTGIDRLRSSEPDVVWVQSEPGRALQMNAGAEKATAEWLLFLHADALPDSRWLDEIHRASAIGAVGGCFALGIASARWPARVIETAVRWRVRWLGIAYGDQGLFLRRELFRQLGGYASIPLMEDADLVRRLQRQGRFYRSRVQILVSARRWERDGWWRRSASNLRILFWYLAGCPPDQLVKLYPVWKGNSSDPAR